MPLETPPMTDPERRGIAHLALTVCVCSSRPPLVRDNVLAWESELAADDELLIVFDGVEADIMRRRESSRIAPPRATRGLSASRNAGLDLASSPRVVFLDDDAIMP